MSREITERMDSLFQKIKDDVSEMESCDTFEDALAEIEHLERTVCSLKNLVKASINVKRTGNPLIEAPYLCGVYGSPESMIWVRNGRVVNGAWTVMVPVDGDGSVVYTPFDKELKEPIPYLFSTADIIDTHVDGYEDVRDYNDFLEKARMLFERGLIEKKSPGECPSKSLEIATVEVYDDYDESIDDIPF